jgi:ATP-dependent Lhr-like helicase
MLTAERSRKLLRSTRTVIVDEIHALARDKRGSHLALSLERLDHVCESSPARIGLSATQRPIERIARLLVGAARAEPVIVDCGHRRALDLAIEIPDSELEAVASAEQMKDVLGKIAAHVGARRTTLVFVNTRRMAERVAHQLGELVGEDRVAAHHGSLSKERRARTEARLRAGDLSALVATASLELGIDIGPIELVCQIGSPRSIATFLQRVGRSGHFVGGTPAGRLYPLTRDELVESVALLSAVRAGKLDAVEPPVAPLDVLAQQIVAECAAEDWNEDELHALFCRAAPYAGLARADFDAAVALVSEGVLTGRGRRAAYVHRDRVHRRLSGRRGARLAALTSGGAIPEMADYRVIADPDETFVGTVNEDWAIESMAGDVFVLGTATWRIRRVEPGTVRVVDATGATPSVPFWLGEAPARTAELSAEVSALRAALDERLALGETVGARRLVEERAGVSSDVAEVVVRYLHAARTALGVLPTAHDVVFERFFDDTGGMQLVVHSPFGARINRGFGLALRKRFCKTFDFELQAAASDDAIVLSLGPQHSFPLEDVPRFLSSRSVDQVLRQAVLVSPMFAARWRWNLNRSLVVLRVKNGKKNPPPIQRMESDDVMAAVFPALAACQENATGPIVIPDHLLVRQTLDDCLNEAMDVVGLAELLGRFEAGEVRVHFRDSREPSPLSHEILNGRPYTFLDDAPLEERRTRAVRLARGLPENPRDLAALDPEAIARVRQEAAPHPESADELSDLLAAAVVFRPDPSLADFFGALAASGRALSVETSGGPLWCAIERRPELEALFPAARFTPDAALPSELEPPEREHAAREAVRGHLDFSGPASVDDLARSLLLPPALVRAALAELELEGFALRGSFDPAVAGEQFCARRLLARIHAYSRDRRRRAIEPATPQDFVRFVLRWQHATPDSRREGKRGLLAVIEKLQGFEAAAGAWEESLLPGRVDGYRPEWLDELCLSGSVVWGRLRSSDGGTEPSTPSRATPITLALRPDLPWLALAARGEREPPAASEAAGPVIEALARRGALFAADLARETGRTPAEIEQALWDGVARGLVTADGFSALRSLLASRSARPERRRLRRGMGGVSAVQGRWALFEPPPPEGDRDELAEAVAEQLLARWGILFWDVAERENLGLRWREVVWALRRLEARGLVLGGRFVSGFVGEQYALPEALELLASVRRSPKTGERVILSACDPLNVVGSWIPGPRVAALRSNRVALCDGVFVAEASGGFGTHAASAAG